MKTPRGARLIVVNETRAAWPVARRWHAVDDWARDALEPSDVEEYVDASRDQRVAGYRGNMVRDLDDEEEVYESAPRLEDGFRIPLGPGREAGGVRRVSIRALTWELDADIGFAHHPQWVTTGWGMTARSAAAHHALYVREYANAVAHHTESRRLAVAAWEIVFWTASKHAEYV